MDFDSRKTKTVGFLCFFVMLLSPPVVFSAEDVTDGKTEQLHSMAFSKLNYRVAEMGTAGTAGKSVRLIILHKLRKGGFNILARDDQVIGEDSSEDARFVLGGTVRKLRCEGTFEQGCWLLVTWELFDKKKSQAVYEVDTWADRSGVTYKNAEEKLVGLIGDALHLLMEREKFKKILKREGEALAADDEDLGSMDTLEPTDVKLVDTSVGSQWMPDPFERNTKRSLRYRKLVVAGTVIGIIGSALIVSTYAGAESLERNRDLTYEKLDVLTALNSVGFGGAGIGLGLLTTGLILIARSKKEERKEKFSKVGFNLGLSLNSAIVHVRF